MSQEIKEVYPYPKGLELQSNLLTMEHFVSASHAVMVSNSIIYSVVEGNGVSGKVQQISKPLDHLQRYLFVPFKIV